MEVTIRTTIKSQNITLLRYESCDSDQASNAQDSSESNGDLLSVTTIPMILQTSSFPIRECSQQIGQYDKKKINKSIQKKHQYLRGSEICLHPRIVI
jgi:hypothetical protein